MLSLMVYFDIFLSLNWSGTSASDAPARYHRTVLAAHHSSAPSSHSYRGFADVWIERATEGIPTLLRSTPTAKEPDPSKPAMLMAGIRKKITDVVSEHVQTPGNADFSRPPNLPIVSMSLSTVGKKEAKLENSARCVVKSTMVARLGCGSFSADSKGVRYLVFQVTKV